MKEDEDIYIAVV